MAKTRSAQRSKKSTSASPLMVRLDDESKSYLAQAAKLRGISMSDYVRFVTVAQARREAEAARQQVILLSAEEQLTLWNALNATPKLTDAQRKLGALMRGEA